jgi:hypothetical protein
VPSSLKWTFFLFLKGLFDFPYFSFLFDAGLIRRVAYLFIAKLSLIIPLGERLGMLGLPSALTDTKLVFVLKFIVFYFLSAEVFISIFSIFGSLLSCFEFFYGFGFGLTKPVSLLLSPDTTTIFP